MNWNSCCYSHCDETVYMQENALRAHSLRSNRNTARRTNIISSIVCTRITANSDATSNVESSSDTFRFQWSGVVVVVVVGSR